MAHTPSLPIDPFLDRIVDHARRSRAVVVTAQPGAGKTTRVPPALAEDGPVVLLQPRRMAARAIASRIADERGWTLGREVGWHVRFDRRFGPDTRVLVVTEGILTARLQTDPLLSDIRTIVLDEFHERSIHADLAIALAKQAWRARDDLRIAVMSATLDSAGVAAFLDGCPIVDVPGRLHPVEISYAPGTAVADAAVDLLDRTAGSVLCFLPGAAEIGRALGEVEQRLKVRDVDVVPLHGSLGAAAQDAAIRPSARRRLVLATNIAETSLTVPGVTAVVDSGLHKIARYDAERAIDSLELERIPADAAEQRAGRAGRVGPGLVQRLWDARDRLRPHREPEIRRIDLCAVALDVIAWGVHPRELEWFERPADDAVQAALTLLERLGLVAGGKLTDIGARVRHVPIHPRLACMLVAARGARAMAQACAVVSERQMLPPGTASTSSDLLSAIDNWHAMPPHVQRVASEIERLAQSEESGQGRRRQSAVVSGFGRTLSESDFCRAVLAGYPDRVAQRRDPGSSRLRLASGAGAVIGAESGVRDGEFLVAIDVQAPRRAGHDGGSTPRRAQGVRSAPNDARVRLASVVERAWLQANGSELVHRFDPQTGTVKAVVVDRYDALVLAERSAAPDPDIAAQLLATAWTERGPAEADRRFLRRLRFAGRDVDVDALVTIASRAARSLDEIRLVEAVPVETARWLDRESPETIAVPSGRSIRLNYLDDGSVSAAVKLQELFGLAETPRIGSRREPIVLSLLAPNGRPVQLTRDLRSFWDRTYPEVRKELRGRYPKHAWPDDPWTATPIAATKRRK